MNFELFLKFLDIIDYLSRFFFIKKKKEKKKEAKKKRKKKKLFVVFDKENR
jgi:hypothetical protein